jgi:hypothetical protein
MYADWQTFKADWITALRSGDYQQGKKRLLEHTEQGDRYCCLGVGADILSKAGHDLQWQRCDNTSVIKSEEAGGLSSIGLMFVGGTPVWLKEVLARRGLITLHKTTEMELMRLNDDGISFSAIARFIEEL